MRFPDFKNMLQVRSLRRQHYFKRLKDQQKHLIAMRGNEEFDFNSEDPAMNKMITNKLLKIKKVRLIEDRLPYEDLAVMENFSEDEITFELNRKIIKEKKDKIALKKARKLEAQL